MNYEKFKGGKVAGVVEHNGRTDKSRPHNHSNEEIDPTRSHLNYDLLERENGMGATAFFNQEVKRIKKEYKEQHGKALRKDAVTLCSWVVTLPKDFEGDERAFFESCVDFFRERYPECIPVTATVHKDETSPHLHYSFIPIQEGRLCAKNLETPTSLKKAHQELQKHLEQALGCECHILNGATDNGNKTILQLKNEELQRENERLKQEIDKLKQAKSEEVFEKTGFLKGVKEKFFGGKKLTAEELEKLKNIVANVDLIDEEYQRATAQAETEKSGYSKLKAELEELKKNEQEKIKREAQSRAIRLSEGAINKLQEERNKAVQSEKEALERTKEVEKQNDNFRSIIKKQQFENEGLKQEIEQLHFEITGKAKTYDEIHAPEKKKSRGMSRC